MKFPETNRAREKANRAAPLLGWLLAFALYARPGAPGQDDSWITQVVAPGARWAEVSEPTQTLIVATHTPAGGQLLLYTLDEAGQPTPEPARIDLTPPAGLSAFTLRALSIACHPTRPIFYVWQDIVIPDANNPPAPELVQRELDHLLSFQKQGDTFVCVSRAIRGPSAAFGMHVGTITVDAEYGRLFLPNLQAPGAEGKPLAVLAFAHLADTGLPVAADDGQPRLTTYKVSWGYSPTGWPTGLIVATRDTVIFGSVQSLTCADLGQTPAMTSGLYYIILSSYNYVVPHPTLSRVYVSPVAYTSAVTVRHAGGFFTMLPRGRSMGVVFNTVPVVVPSRNLVAYGGGPYVQMHSIDEGGEFAGPVRNVQLPTPQVRALAISRKHDRLYAVTEAAP